MLTPLIYCILVISMPVLSVMMEEIFVVVLYTINWGEFQKLENDTIVKCWLPALTAIVRSTMEPNIDTGSIVLKTRETKNMKEIIQFKR